MAEKVKLKLVTHPTLYRSVGGSLEHPLANGVIASSAHVTGGSRGGSRGLFCQDAVADSGGSWLGTFSMLANNSIYQGSIRSQDFLMRTNLGWNKYAVYKYHNS